MPPVLVREVVLEVRHTVRAVVIGLACAMVVSIGVTRSTRTIRCFGGDGSKTDVARGTVKKYAFEAFPEWALAHPDRSCPRSLLELDDYMAPSRRVDPWGNPYYFACGARAIPKTATGVWILSAGPDGVFGTDDDVRSDE